MRREIIRIPSAKLYNFVDAASKCSFDIHVTYADEKRENAVITADAKSLAQMEELDLSRPLLLESDGIDFEFEKFLRCEGMLQQKGGTGYLYQAA